MFPDHTEAFWSMYFRHWVVDYNYFVWSSSAPLRWLRCLEFVNHIGIHGDGFRKAISIIY